jgi:hypothetical protein
LEAQGLGTKDIEAETQAGQSGWLQDMNQTITALSGGKGFHN